MALSNRIVVFILIAIMGLIVIFSATEGWNFVTKTEFCEMCHGIEYEKFITPGDSLDYVHNEHGITCTQCHEPAGSIGTLVFKKEIGKMLIYDVTGLDAPPAPEEIVKLENMLRCIKCHEDYISRTSRRMINPHEDVEDCNSCHKGHERGMSEQTCGECHVKPIQSLNLEGGKHSKKGCAFCHPQHGYKPKCTDCHGVYHPSGFEDCSLCHVDAHAPRDIEFSSVISENECAKCHAPVIQTTFETQPTKHAELDCTLCHPVHGDWLECTSCHVGHDDTMTQQDCEHCHIQGHIPTQVDYPTDTPSTLCGGCHEENARHLKENITGHSNKNCAYCHPQHGQIPSCTTCHGSKHGMSSGCTTCHQSAHNLGFPTVK